MDFIVQTWLVPEEHVPDLGQKQAEAVDAVARILGEGLDLAPELLESLETEIVLLGGKLQENGQG
jgi:hypothetical protein